MGKPPSTLADIQEGERMVDKSLLATLLEELYSAESKS
jgi:hypothetical protein